MYSYSQMACENESIFSDYVIEAHIEISNSTQSRDGAPECFDCQRPSSGQLKHEDRNLNTMPKTIC